MRKNSVLSIRAALTVTLAVVLLRSSAAGAAMQPSATYDFSKAKVVDRVILSVIEEYYDPERIDANKMFMAIMDALQKGIAELKVDYDAEKGTAKVEMVRASMTLSTSDINSPWSLSADVRKVFKFIAAHLPKSEYDMMELEYGAANALLATLDPHSNALPPDIFKNLQMDTAGQFGGLGIKITTDRRPPCKGRLTVVEVFNNTPAAEAGIVMGDTIVRIDDESTVNITTSEAADRLRGVPGTKVKVQIKHQNGAVQDYTITRRMVPIASVEWEMLKEKVGYIKLNAFQENSGEEMTEALEKLHEKDMKSLILDLRGNPGGLLHIAISIVNMFLSSGTIVTTAGRTEEDRTVENAEAEGTEPMYPMAVLIDSFSASAAEIMAGALRNHGRALLIGETTFGKGSVQMVDQIPDGGAIKLTSAQYLTPGDISIQAVGVIPDLTFVPVVADKDEIHMKNAGAGFSEADLEAHLDRPNIRTRTDRNPAVTATLPVPPSEAQVERDRFRKCFADEEIDDSYKARYEKEAARRLLAAADRSSAEDLLIQARAMVEKDAPSQEKTLENAFRKLKVDWSPGTQKDASPAPEQTPNPKVTAVAKILDKISQGKKFQVRVTVENRSSETIYRLHAATESDNFLLAGHEFVFGKLRPKEKKTWTKTITLPAVADARVDDMKFNFNAAGGPVPAPVSLEVKIPTRTAPNLIFGWQVQDGGNGDGIFQPGEALSMYISVKNIGEGATMDAEVELSAKPGIDIEKGLLEIGTLAPGATVEGVLQMSVIKQFPLPEAELTLAIREWTETALGIPTTRSLKERTIKLPISSTPNSLKVCDEAVTVTNGEAMLRESPNVKSPQVASAPKGTTFKADGIVGNFYRIALSDRRRAWIERETVTTGGTPAPVYQPFMQVPPKIDIKGSTIQRSADKHIIVKGTASHPNDIRDVIVFVGDKKVLYLPATDKTGGTRLDFSATVPLEEGANHIMVIARHNDKVMSMQTLFVRRDASK